MSAVVAVVVFAVAVVEVFAVAAFAVVRELLFL